MRAPRTATQWGDGRFLPRGAQRPFMYAFAMEWYRLYVLALHRRYGKGRMFINAGGAKAREQGWGVWHTLPTFAQGRSTVWTATDAHGRRLLEDLLPYTTETGVNDAAMRLSFPGGGFYQVMGTDKFNKRIGAGVSCICYDEFSLQNPMARNYYSPILKERRGAEVFMFTFRGENHAAGVFDFATAYPEEAFCLDLSIEDTVRDAPREERFGERVITEDDLDFERRLYASSNGKLGMSESMIRQEYFNSREGVNQAQVYGKEMAEMRKRGGVTRVPHDPLKLVHTAWDRGVHNRIGFFQRDGRIIRCIDHLSTDNSSLTEIALLMREGHRAKYNYGKHYVGRDAEDPTPWSPKTGLQMAEDIGIKLTIVPHLSILTGIEQTRAALARCEFDAKLCEAWVNALREYSWAVDPITNEIKGKEPDRTQLSRHDADMTRYLALAEEEDKPTTPAKPRSSYGGPRGYLVR